MKDRLSAMIRYGTPWQTVWWSITTVTTVGYGDRFPVTGKGRLVAVGLLSGGIASLGVVTASFASGLIERVERVARVEEASQRRPVGTWRRLPLKLPRYGDSSLTVATSLVTSLGRVPETEVTERRSVTVMRVVAGLLLALALVSGCGDGPSDSAPTASPSERSEVGKRYDELAKEAAAKKASAKTTPSVKAVSYGSVIELRDAAIEAGYPCRRWIQDNGVTLAAESGNCGDESVLSTYASAGDLQAQLRQEKVNSQMLLEANIATEPILVGSNWLFKAPGAPRLRPQLGGVVIGAKRPR